MHNASKKTASDVKSLRRDVVPVLICGILLSLASCATTSGPPTSRIVVQPKPLKSIFHVASGASNDTLYTIYPNPFSRTEGDTAVLLRFGIIDTSEAIVLIQNPIGDEIAVYRDSTLPPGTYPGAWNPVASDGSALNPGIYFVTLRVNDTLQHKGYISSQVLNILNN